MNVTRTANTDKQTVLRFFVNADKFILQPWEVRPDQSLLSFLRSRSFLGAKEVCGEGGCGACTVQLTKKIDERLEHFTVASCLVPLPFVDHMQVTTIEGLNSSSSAPSSDVALHPVSEAIVRCHGSQCGMCTPGFSIALSSHLHNHPRSTQVEIEECFDGNLCRCTAYRPILDASKMFASDHRPVDPEQKRSRDELQAKLRSWPGPDTRFPAELEHERPGSMEIRGSNCIWYRPVALEELLELKSTFPLSKLLGGVTSYPWEERGYSQPIIAKIVAGFTDVGYQERYSPHHYPLFVSTAAVPELHRIEWTADGLSIGAAASINRVVDAIRTATKMYPADKMHLLEALVTQMRFFANHQVRDLASLGGGLVTGSYLSDIVPVVVALNATLELRAAGNRVRFVQATEFIAQDGTPCLGPEEVLVAVHVRFSGSKEFAEAYKQARRRVDTIALVNAGMRVKLSDAGDLVEEVTLCFGGLGRTGARAVDTERFLSGKAWTPSLLAAAQAALERELTSLSTCPLPKYIRSYQCRVAASFFLKFFWEVQRKLGNAVPPEIAASLGRYQHLPHSGLQHYREQTTCVGRALTNINAPAQAAGQARFTSDMQLPPDGLFAALVTSSQPHATLKSLDPSRALATAGVVGFFSAADIPGTNRFGLRVKDEEFLASTEVQYYGQPIGVVVAKDPLLAREAAAKVVAEYFPLPAILTIDDAVKQQSFFAPPLSTSRGDVDRALAASDLILEGQVNVGAQYAFYLEPHCAVVFPRPGGSFSVWSSTQSPSNVLECVAAALNLREHTVEVQVERVGGAFGGKQLRAGPIAAIAAVPAHHLGRPVKLGTLVGDPFLPLLSHELAVLDRVEDMQFCPGRSPWQAKYKVGCTKDGRMTALQVDLISDGGCSQDYSQDITETAMLLLDNGYCLPPDLRLTCLTAKTHKGSFTSTRGFGKPEAAAIIEVIIDHVASAAATDPTDVRSRMLYKRGDRTLTGTEIADNVLQRCWSLVLEKANYAKMKSEVEAFNASNVWRKRGLGVVAGKGNMGFLESNDINRGLCILHVYKDGTVLISHSGVELGQGLNTRMMQIAADQLGVPLELIRVATTSTLLAPNTPPTTMVTSDLVGSALLVAAQRINERLLPLRQEHSSLSFRELVATAYDRGIELTTTGIKTQPRLAYDYQKQQGLVSYFFIWSAAVSLVELDLFTGSHRLLRTEIVQDCGNSLNPALDVGQVESCFLFGAGYYTLEDLIWDPKDGHIITHNVAGYKVPSHDDIPLQMNVTILNDTPSPEGVCSSKGVGDASVQLGMSVHQAIKEAIRAARRDVGETAHFQLELPATVIKILDHIPLRKSATH